MKVIVTGGTLSLRVDGSVMDERVDRDECATDVFLGTTFDGFFIVTVERGGTWYFSPIETVVEYARLALQSELAR